MPPPASQIVKQRRMVVAAVVVGGQRALAVDGPAEFAAPDDQRVVEQPALLQVGDQRGRRLSVSRHWPAICLGRCVCWSQPRGRAG